MRLLLVIPNVLSYGFFRELCTELAADGVETHLACSRRQILGATHSAPEGTAAVHEIQFARGMNPARHLRAARALNQLVRSVRPDLVHAHFSAAIFATALGRTAHWPATIATFHGLSFPAVDGWKRSLLRRVETWSARRCDAVWVLSDDDRARLRSALPELPVETLRSCGVGCNLTKFAPPSPEAKAARRAELGFAPEHRVFAFVGRFVDFKGFALTARAFLRVARENPSARLLLIGARDELHATGLTRAEEQALEESSLVLQVGYRRDVYRYLAAADAMVFPSHREGRPVCVMEALAMGVPVITRDARGCRDLVRDGVNGIVLRECTVKNLCAAMHELSRDLALCDYLGANAAAERERFARGHFIREQKQITFENAAPAAARKQQLQPAYL